MWLPVARPAARSSVFSRPCLPMAHTPPQQHTASSAPGHRHVWGTHFRVDQILRSQSSISLGRLTPASPLLLMKRAALDVEMGQAFWGVSSPSLCQSCCSLHPSTLRRSSYFPNTGPPLGGAPLLALPHSSSPPGIQGQRSSSQGPHSSWVVLFCGFCFK